MYYVRLALDYLEMFVCAALIGGSLTVVYVAFAVAR